MKRTVSGLSRLAAVMLTGFAAFSMVGSVPAAAASCKTWSASLAEDEGGPAMTATVCADDADGAPALVLQCGAPLDLRYDLGEKASADLDPGISARFSFTDGTTSVTRQLDLQAMDNMFVIDLKPADLLLSILQSGHEVSVVDTAGKYSTNTFSLSGSRAAIAKVSASCHASKPATGDDDD